MGMIDRVSDRMGLSAVHAEIEIADRYVFHGTPFTVNLHITSGRKGARIDHLTIELIWERWMRSRGAAYSDSQYLVSGGQKDWYESRSIVKMNSVMPFRMRPGERKTMSFVLSTETAGNFAFPDRFLVKVHIDIPSAPDTREEARIEVLPEVEVCAPMIAMVDGLGFRMRHWKTIDDGSNHRNQWLLDPPENRYPHLESLRITTPDWKFFSHEVILEMNMSGELERETPVMKETMRSSFPIELDDLIDPSGGIKIEEISERIGSLLEGAERDFVKILRVR